MGSMTMGRNETMKGSYTSVEDMLKPEATALARQQQEDQRRIVERERMLAP